MYISKMKLNNFKGFKGAHEVGFSKRMNFFVGNNNCGKTTIFHAIDFLVSGGSKDNFVTKGADTEEISVEIEIRGENLMSFIADSTDPNLIKCIPAIIENEDGTFSVRLRRSSEDDIKKIKIYIPESDSYENRTGFDKAAKMIFDPLIIYSDMDNKDSRDFGKTKMLGRIINNIIVEIQDSEPWRRLKTAHEELFSGQEVTEKIAEVEHSLDETIRSQYGETKVKINFELPEIDVFSKNGKLELLDNNVETDISEKGTGLQRALAIALLQVYAKISRGESEKPRGESEKPRFLFIDEPETFLHPQAQDRLIEALNESSDNHQIFITTHSPYLLKKFDKDNHGLLIFKKNNNENANPERTEALDLFGEYSPSWGEINYFAFEVSSVEFHNELYGFLHSKVGESEGYYSIGKLDDWLSERGIEKNKAYIKEVNGQAQPQPSYNVTLPTYIRNLIHHPENTRNDRFSSDELKESIDHLVRICREM